MLNKNELKIISAFFPEGTERTTKEIEDRSGYSHERAYSILKTLENKGFLSKKKVGKTLVYSIKKFNDIVYLSFAYYSINRKNHFIEKYSSVSKAIEEFINKTKLELVILFGSYSKNEAK
jgi:sugar-specific transcriptional regulator TrmB